MGVAPDDTGSLRLAAAKELIPCQLLSRSIGSPKFICSPCVQEAVTQYAILFREIVKREKEKA